MAKTVKTVVKSANLKLCEKRNNNHKDDNGINGIAHEQTNKHTTPSHCTNE